MAAGWGWACLGVADARAGAGAEIAAMASLLWEGDPRAAESERLNSHVTVTDREGRGTGARTALPGESAGGGERGVQWQRGDVAWQGLGKGPWERRPRESQDFWFEGAK